MHRTFWALYRLSDRRSGQTVEHWVIRAERPGAPGYLVQLCELADELADLRAEVVRDSALATRTDADSLDVDCLGWASPLVGPEDAACPLMALHGTVLDLWVAWPRSGELGASATLSLWTAKSEEDFWAWVEESEYDRTIEQLARPAERLWVRSWTPWDFRLWESDPLLVPELSWLAGDAWEAWDRHDEVDLDALAGPREPCPELSDAEHRAIWVRRFDRLIEQRRAIDDLRARAFDLSVLAQIDASATLERVDALLDELRATEAEVDDWEDGVAWALEKMGDSPERRRRLERWKGSPDPCERSLWSAWCKQLERNG